MSEKNWDQAHRILCIRPDNLGDVLMCTPAMRALQQSAPGRSLVLLASASGAAAARFIPELHDVIAHPAPWVKCSDARHADADMALIRTLHSHRFDAAVIFTSYSQSPLPAALLCHLADIPLRLAHCHENPYHLLSHWIVDPEPATTVRHEVRRQLDLVTSVGSVTDDERLSFSIRHADASWARRHLQSLGIDLSRNWLLLHPGASAPSRRYPAHLWIDTANRLAALLGCPLIFTGSASKAPLVEQIRSGMASPTYSMAGALDLGQFAALLSLAPAIISNNTGPVHLAAAVGTPVIDLYALTNPQHTPWQVPNRVLYHDVPCRDCYKSICPEGHHHCLAKVTPERVVHATIELLRDTHGSIAEQRSAHAQQGKLKQASFTASIPTDAQFLP